MSLLHQQQVKVKQTITLKGPPFTNLAFNNCYHKHAVMDIMHPDYFWYNIRDNLHFSSNALMLSKSSSLAVQQKVYILLGCCCNLLFVEVITNGLPYYRPENSINCQFNNSTYFFKKPIRFAIFKIRTTVFSVRKMVVLRPT